MAGALRKSAAIPAAQQQGRAEGRATTAGRQVNETDARALAQRTLLAKADGLTAVEQAGLNARAQGMAEGDEGAAIDARAAEAERLRAEEERRRRVSRYNPSGATRLG